ncbi:hypothetical protein SPHINGO391_460134 [Sphingomonas aurantiaca]|uniref:Uncharacterized protein n=1 Tax=Sphingomonas aurantiaca TaxID=185949 RepID=A0A5E7ZRF1_9SPHN|nr:hypothetical protein SPHINGO391_460134 [Sphingomonas aurantiaca]
MLSAVLKPAVSGRARTATVAGTIPATLAVRATSLCGAAVPACQEL